MDLGGVTLGGEVPLYDEFGESYDTMVAWDERLAREEPFFRTVFGRGEGVRRVLDVGSATGGHVLHFASMGLEAVGAEPSAEMVRLARDRAAGAERVDFVQAGFGELRRRLDGTFDAVTCLGNTLPHVESRDGLDRAMADMASMLRAGGVLVIQQLNYDRIMAERRRFLGVSSGVRDGVEHLFFRFYDFEDGHLVFNVVTFRKGEEGWGFQAGATRLMAILQRDLAESLTAAGFGEVSWYGGLDMSEFDATSSGDLVVVAAKRVS